MFWLLFARLYSHILNRFPSIILHPLFLKHIPRATLELHFLLTCNMSLRNSGLLSFSIRSTCPGHLISKDLHSLLHNLHPIFEQFTRFYHSFYISRPSNSQGPEFLTTYIISLHYLSNSEVSLIPSKSPGHLIPKDIHSLFNHLLTIFEQFKGFYHSFYMSRPSNFQGASFFI